MKFFEKHFNKHHFIRAPHKWFLAALISPIHAGQVHYQKRYHLQYRHARKLFVFDLALLSSTIVLLATIAVVHFYDPTITADISLSISTNEERIQSGQEAEFIIEYANDSQYVLTDTKLALQLPIGFLPSITTPENSYESHTRTFTLGDIVPGQSSMVSISGQLFAEPEDQKLVGAFITYTSEKTGRRESKAVHFQFTARGSVLVTSVESPTETIAGSNMPFTLELHNTGEFPLANLEIPLLQEQGDVSNTEISTGDIVKDLWKIDRLDAGATTSLRGSYTIPSNAKNNVDLGFTPQIHINETIIHQGSQSHTYNVKTPELRAQTSWDVNEIKPGDSAQLNLTLQNTGNTNFDSVAISIPVNANIISTNAFISQNNARISNNAFVVTTSKLSPQSSQTITINVPIIAIPRLEKNKTLSLPITLSGTVPNISTPYQLTTQSADISIGTYILLNAESRYYTNEGDQLGRGPLPPVIGKQTKYWVFVTAQNGSNDVTQARFSAKLAPGVTWTGKTSVSTGEDIIYNQNSGSISWSRNSVPAFTTVGIYMELAVTPSASEVESVPQLLQNIQFSAYDTFIGETITKSTPNISANLPNDPTGQNKGITVQ